jgi:hypothetical protein
MIPNYQSVSKTYFSKGNLTDYSIYRQVLGRKALKISNYETGHVICSEENSYDVHAFLRFLKKVLDFYPAGKIVMVLDNSKIHHVKLLQHFLKKTLKVRH